MRGLEAQNKDMEDRAIGGKDGDCSYVSTSRGKKEPFLELLGNPCRLLDSRPVAS